MLTYGSAPSTKRVESSALAAFNTFLNGNAFGLPVNSQNLTEQQVRDPDTFRNFIAFMHSKNYKYSTIDQYVHNVLNWYLRALTMQGKEQNQALSEETAAFFKVLTPGLFDSWLHKALDLLVRQMVEEKIDKGLPGTLADTAVGATIENISRVNLAYMTEGSAKSALSVAAQTLSWQGVGRTGEVACIMWDSMDFDSVRIK
jgi:hypothetical protein